MITSSVQLAGVLLVFSLFSRPGGLRHPAGPGPWLSLAFAWGVGFAASVLDCSLSYAEHLPTGATAVCTFSAVLVALDLGWLGRHLLKRERKV
ncbi:MAG: metal ABC transporter permease [Candidatus Handelsmanbacteria bacterium]|nr:metal ABC transporter permease [Candidatus Handelsmanbacteria bacterium]